MTSGIYLITCTRPGALPLYYVGQSADITRRRQEHFGELRRGSHYNAVLNRAYKKYGHEAFKFEVLEAGEADELNAMEQFWLDSMYGSDRCANMAGHAESPGKGRKTTEETRRRMAEVKTGTRHTEETRRRISEIQTGKKRGPHKAETRHKIGAAQVGAQNHAFGKKGAAHHRSKPIEGACVVTGAIIRFESAHLAKAAGFSQSAISSVCAGKWETHKGYRWRFVTSCDE
jgi:group I intron endonuclease